MPVERELNVPLNTFILRFWRERGNAGVHWRGQIQHIQSGEHAAFTNGVALICFIQRWVQLPENGGECAETVEPPGDNAHPNA